ncbi:sensor histidine kinase [Aliikangiella coralliicola]|nr:HAMP domain-containing sensor histidine kinase [Aliikangiella coralliicola]
MNQKTPANSHQSKILRVLLVVNFLLMVTLGWQALTAILQQRNLVGKMLHEYAELAAEEFSRRIMADVGYKGYFSQMNLWRDSVELVTSNKDEIARCPLTSHPLLSSASLGKKFFLVENNELVVISTLCNKVEFAPAIADKLVNFNRNELAEKPFAFIHTNYSGTPVTLIVTQFKEKNLLGFQVNRESLRRLLQSSFDKSSLLPEVIANGKATNSIILLSMVDHTGDLLIGEKINHNYDVATKILADEYSGIFRNHQIRVAIKTDNIEELIIGGQPEDNLPVILATMIILIVIFIVTFIQLRKEQQLSRLRERFVAEVSHELRTPLTQIRMFAETLIKGRARNEEESQHYLQVINRESIRLNHLVENILRYSSSENTGELKLTQLAIVPFLNTIIEEINPIRIAKNVAVKCDLESCEIAIHKDNFRRIILNLLDNAIKYGPDRQTIEIKGQIIQRSGKRTYRLTINDEGPGIPSKYHTNIWQAYYRLPRESNQAIAGTGIGLYLVKRLVTEINGSIKLKNREPNGCSFLLELNLDNS